MSKIIFFHILESHLFVCFFDFSFVLQLSLTLTLVSWIVFFCHTVLYYWAPGSLYCVLMFLLLDPRKPFHREIVGIQMSRVCDQTWKRFSSLNYQIHTFINHCRKLTSIYLFIGAAKQEERKCWSLIGIILKFNRSSYAAVNNLLFCYGILIYSSLCLVAFCCVWFLYYNVCTYDVDCVCHHC